MNTPRSVCNLCDNFGSSCAADAASDCGGRRRVRKNKLKFVEMIHGKRRRRIAQKTNRVGEVRTVLYCTWWLF